MLDRSETYIKHLSHAIVDIYKLCVEEMGYDFDATNNKIEYRNYLVDDPIRTYNNSYDPLTDNPDNAYSFIASKFVDYNGAPDGSIGSKDFPQGKGKCISPDEQYWPFYTFGFGASPKTKSDKAHSKRSGVECCKLAINTIMNYLNKGCKTIGDVICMYHAGVSTYDEFIKYASTHNYKDIADGRTVSGTEMINRQNYYQQHLVDYTHMSNKTPLERSYKVLFPLITFISRQEQGVNCESACKIALNEMGIT